ncbi:hypothetical protein FA10DRAFT_257078 [Acaromyces ingoldii]|uniref:Solute carrier family 40 member n=1 Tax=Acaromyces ingoldii TaxID=215250 RepID=A0A316YU70_9BASI|nr:hypothetical protein FA10DRAFT_257078 [Acaromyces ingoldii]PWN92606.1 hypothetical protein FA10DRAFT_257078 [Acaromyces ingoldii]
MSARLCDERCSSSAGSVSRLSLFQVHVSDGMIVTRSCSGRHDLHPLPMYEDPRMATTEPDIPLRPVGSDDEAETERDELDLRALVLLALQQASSSFSFRTAEFAYPLYFVALYPDSLLPASLYGFVTTAAAIVLSSTVGHLVDRFATHRLALVRCFVLAQKAFVCGTYALFLPLFRHWHKQHQDAAFWPLFVAITALGCALILANVGVSVVTERDWITSIAEGSPRRLTRLNAIMRRIDLLSKLLAPLFVSLLTSQIGYPLSCVVLLATSAATTLFEFFSLGVVFRRFAVLALEQQRAREQRPSAPARAPFSVKSVRRWLAAQYHDWRTFSAMPVFISSLSISLLYMSVLSFDASFVAYLKSETTYSDPFIAGMRGACVVAGLVGTFVSPLLTQRIGLVRTGSWSLWMELLPLTPVLAAFYCGTASPSRPWWNGLMLFGGLALSRIGLWSFDLAQLAQVQLALAGLPQRKNALMALQFSLQSILDMAHHALTLGWNKPAQFANAAATSYAAIALATFLYVGLYARRERGHLLHLDALAASLLRQRKPA